MVRMKYRGKGSGYTGSRETAKRETRKRLHAPNHVPLPGDAKENSAGEALAALASSDAGLTLAEEGTPKLKVGSPLLVAGAAVAVEPVEVEGTGSEGPLAGGACSAGKKTQIGAKHIK